jgi:transcriptional regulator with XRE-family HTH domain
MAVKGANMPEKSFARRLTQLREAAQLSQYELAKRAGVTRQTLSRLEMGDSVPNWPTVQALARALGVDCTAFQTDDQAEAGEPQPKKRKGK